MSWHTPEPFDPNVGKGQIPRLWDVFVLGPAMIWAASQRKPLPPAVRVLLFTAGVATIVYNGRNYYRVKEYWAGGPIP